MRLSEAVYWAGGLVFLISLFVSGPLFSLFVGMVTLSVSFGIFLFERRGRNLNRRGRNQKALYVVALLLIIVIGIYIIYCLPVRSVIMHAVCDLIFRYDSHT